MNPRTLAPRIQGEVGRNSSTMRWRGSTSGPTYRPEAGRRPRARCGVEQSGRPRCRGGKNCPATQGRPTRLRLRRARRPGDRPRGSAARRSSTARLSHGCGDESHPRWIAAESGRAGAPRSRAAQPRHPRGGGGRHRRVLRRLHARRVSHLDVAQGLQDALLCLPRVSIRSGRSRARRRRSCTATSRHAAARPDRRWDRRCRWVHRTCRTSDGLREVTA